MFYLRPCLEASTGSRRTQTQCSDVTHTEARTGERYIGHIQKLSLENRIIPIIEFLVVIMREDTATTVVISYNYLLSLLKHTRANHIKLDQLKGANFNTVEKPALLLLLEPVESELSGIEGGRCSVFFEI